MSLILIVIFGIIGVVLRFYIQQFLPYVNFPWAILLVNAVGSFFAGVVASKMDLSATPTSTQQLYLAIMIGGLGGLTTFSSFAADTVRFLHASNYSAALLNIFANNILCLSLCFLGFRLFRPM
jgi:CrcB protein